MSLDSHLFEFTLQREVVYDGQLLQVHCDQVRLPDQQVAVREYIHHPGAVAILPLLDEQHIILERQYRHPLGQVIYEIPAGKRDIGELPLQCAQRELQEETGYVAQQWIPLGTFHPCVGYSDELIHLFVAQNLQGLGQRELDEGEFLDVLVMPLAEAMQKIESGEITDAKTILALLRCLCSLQQIYG